VGRNKSLKKMRNITSSDFAALVNCSEVGRVRREDWSPAQTLTFKNTNILEFMGQVENGQ
jgi:hypothetical protein